MQCILLSIQCTCTIKIYYNGFCYRCFIQKLCCHLLTVTQYCNPELVSLTVHEHNFRCHDMYVMICRIWCPKGLHFLSYIYNAFIPAWLSDRTSSIWRTQSASTSSSFHPRSSPLSTMVVCRIAELCAAPGWLTLGSSLSFLAPGFYPLPNSHSPQILQKGWGSCTTNIRKQKLVKQE